MPRGFFLTFEGIDGSGKTTQIERLVASLQRRNLSPVRAQEPGGTRVGLQIRRILLDPANGDLLPMAELLLYFASRAQNVAEVIRPALEQGRVVVGDRYTDATVAYQGYGRGLGRQGVDALHELACAGIAPDLTIWLDIAPEAALARARARNQSQGFEGEGRMESQTMQFFRRVRQGYADLHAEDPARFRRVEATGSPGEVADRVLAEVWPALRRRLPHAR